MAGKKQDKDTVLVRAAVGPWVRMVGEYEFSEATGWVQAVDLETAANLLTYPTPNYFLAERPSAAIRQRIADILGIGVDNIVWPAGGGEAETKAEPLLRDIVGEREAEFAALGVTSVPALAALDEEGIERLATGSGASREEVKGWVAEAAGQL
jgi:hypothetical protein